MNRRKTMVRFFTIADYEEEERWLSARHQSGWKLTRIIPPCFYIFEECEPQHVVYRLDYKNNSEDREYFQLFSDYGWEYFASFAGWLYFRKPASEADTQQDMKIFSDDASRIEMINQILKTRLLPLVIVLFCCLVPSCIQSARETEPLATVLTVIFSIFTLLYAYLSLHCGIKLQKLKDRYHKN